MISLHLKSPDTVLPPRYNPRPFQNRDQQQHPNQTLQHQGDTKFDSLRSRTSPARLSTSDPHSDALVSKEEIKFSNLLSSTEFDHLMDEFNSLMAQVPFSPSLSILTHGLRHQVEKKDPVRPSTPIHPAFSRRSQDNEFPSLQLSSDPMGPMTIRSSEGKTEMDSAIEPSTSLSQEGKAEKYFSHFKDQIPSENRVDDSHSHFSPRMGSENGEEEDGDGKENLFYPQHSNSEWDSHLYQRFLHPPSQQQQSESRLPVPRTQESYRSDSRLNPSSSISRNDVNRAHEMQGKVTSSSNCDLDRSENDSHGGEGNIDWERGGGNSWRGNGEPGTKAVMRMRTDMSDSRSQFIKDSLEFSAEFDSLQQERNKLRERKSQIKTGVRDFGMDHRESVHKDEAGREMEPDQSHHGDRSYQFHSSQRLQQSSEVGRYHDQGDWDEEDADGDVDQEVSQNSNHTDEQIYQDEGNFELHDFQDEGNEEEQKELAYLRNSTGLSYGPKHLGVEELTMVNESLMSSLQFEREAKDRLVAENRSLEVLCDSIPP